MAEHKADYRDCLDLAGRICDSVESYDSDYLPEAVIPHLQPVIGKLQNIESVCNELLAALKRLLEERNPFVTTADSCECGELGTGFDDDGNACEHIQSARAIAKAELLTR